MDENPWIEAVSTSMLLLHLPLPESPTSVRTLVWRRGSELSIIFAGKTSTGSTSPHFHPQELSQWYDPFATVRRKTTPPTYAQSWGKGLKSWGCSESCLSLVGLASRVLLVPSRLLGVLPNAQRDIPAKPPPLPVESPTREE